MNRQKCSNEQPALIDLPPITLNSIHLQSSFCIFIPSTYIPQPVLINKAALSLNYFFHFQTGSLSPYFQPLNNQPQRLAINKLFSASLLAPPEPCFIQSRLSPHDLQINQTRIAAFVQEPSRIYHCSQYGPQGNLFCESTICLYNQIASIDEPSTLEYRSMQHQKMATDEQQLPCESGYEFLCAAWQPIVFWIFCQSPPPSSGRGKSAFCVEFDSHSYDCYFQSQNYHLNKPYYPFHSTISSNLFSLLATLSTFIYSSSPSAFFSTFPSLQSPKHLSSQVEYQFHFWKFVLFSIKTNIEFSMLKKTKIQQHPNTKNKNNKTLPLSRLEEISLLEHEVINILGQKNIDVDNEADIFERIEQIYLKYLQGIPLGLEVLKKINRLIGDAEAPAKIKMMYLLAHQSYLQEENPLPVLQEAFYANLHHNQKTLAGYQCGLILSQLSMCPRLVQNTLSALVVSLEEEIGFHPNGLRQLYKPDHKSSKHQLKSVYLGSRLSHKSKLKFTDCCKLQRLDLSKCLYEAYTVGYQRLQSQAKRRYYCDCQQQLGRRLIRQNPGFNIKDKLKSIDQGQTSVKQFQKGILPLQKSILNLKKQQFSKSDPLKLWGQGKRKNSQQSQKIQAKTLGQFPMSASCNVSPKKQPHKAHTSQMSQHFPPKFKIQLKQNFRRSKPNTSKSSSRNSRSSGIPLQIEKEPSKRLVETQDKENQKTISLKFNRLQQKASESKPEIRKRKIKAEIHWQQKQHDNFVQNVYNFSYMPNIKEDPSQEMGSQTEQAKPLPHFIQVQSKNEIESLMEIGEEVSAKKIDNLLKQGIEWISNLGETEEQQLNIFKKQNQEDHLEQVEESLEQSIDQENKVSKLKMPRDTFSLKESLKFDMNQLQIPHSPSESFIESKRDSVYDQSFTQSYNSKHRCSREQSQRSQSVQYKILINNYEEQHKNQPSGIGITVGQYISSVTEELIHTDQSTKASNKSPVNVVNTQFVQGFNQNISKQAQNQTIQAAAQVCQSSDALTSKEKVQSFNEVKENQSKKTFGGQTAKEVSFNLSKNSCENIEKCSQKKIKQVLSPQSLKQIRAEEVNKYVQSMFKSIINGLCTFSSLASNLSGIQTNKRSSQLSNKGSSQFSNQGSKNTLKSIPEAKMHPRSSISDRLFDDTQLQQRFDEIKERVNSEIDDSDLSSQIHTSSERFSAPFSPHSKSTSKKGDRNSHFTCSRFAGSKIEYEKQSTLNMRSHMNIIEQLINSIQSTDNRGTEKEIPENSPTMMNIRSKIHSQHSSKSNKKAIQSEESPNITFKASAEDINHQQNVHFEHWLLPVLSFTEQKVCFEIAHCSEPVEHARKQKQVPLVLREIKNQLSKAIQSQIGIFLDKFPKQQTSWQRIIEQFEKVQLIPQKIAISAIEVKGQQSEQYIKLSFDLHLSQNTIVPRSSEKNIKLYPLSLKLNGTISSILQKLEPKNIIFNQNEVNFQNLWTIVGKRNIKLRDKYQNATLHCLFQVNECYLSTENAYFYEVTDQNGEHMNFGHIPPSLRKKVINNIDMIIGFAIKLTNKKIHFSPENISQLVKLL